MFFVLIYFFYFFLFFYLIFLIKIKFFVTGSGGGLKPIFLSIYFFLILLTSFSLYIYVLHKVGIGTIPELSCAK